MSPMVSIRNRIASRIFASIGALIALTWLLTYPLPIRQEMMLDVILSFLLTIMLTVLLWWTSRCSISNRAFWALLATGWALNLVSNVAWGASEMATGESVALFGWIDVIYVTRYIVVFVAFWRCTGRPGRQQWASLVTVAAAVTAATWLLVFRPTLASPDVELSHILYFLSGAIYPIMDAVLIYAAILVWTRTAEQSKKPFALLTLAMISYGIANCINWSTRMASLEAESGLAAFLWLLTDVLTGSAALYVLWQDISLTGIVDK
ncbi:MAG: hypothetical protein GY832_16900 [Chloroflexi bacterium]|nr:hypothetical protein [Chloroflexota bacterium]